MARTQHRDAVRCRDITRCHLLRLVARFAPHRISHAYGDNVALNISAIITHLMSRATSCFVSSPYLLNNISIIPHSDITPRWHFCAVCCASKPRGALRRARGACVHAGVTRAARHRGRARCMPPQHAARCNGVLRIWRVGAYRHARTQQRSFVSAPDARVALSFNVKRARVFAAAFCWPLVCA